MINITGAHIHRFAKKLLISLLVVSHIALTIPLSEIFAMESANFRIKESSVSSGGGNNAGTSAAVAYSSAAEGVVAEKTESANYRASIGFVNTIASNPPIFKALIPDANMRIVWDKGQTPVTTIGLDSYFISPDNSPITYTAEGNSGITVVINPVSHVAAFSQSPEFSGSEAVRFIATDANKNKAVSNFVMLAVKAPVNNPPIIHPIDDITVKEGELVRVTPVVFDPDGGSLAVTYSAPLNDSGAWQTTYSDAGDYKVTATVSDGTLKASRAFNIKVKNTNRPPIIDAIPDMIVNEGDMVRLNATAHDPDGDNVTVSYSSPLDADGGWQTTYRDAGVYRFTVTASDGDLSAVRNVNVTVNDFNAPPLIELTTDKTNLAMNENFTIYVLAQDPDGNSLKLTIKKDGTAIPGCEDIPLGGQTFTKMLSIASAGSHKIDAVVTETGVSGTPNTASASLKITVEENSPASAYMPVSGDFNGDGLTDLGYCNKDMGIWKIQLSNSDGVSGPVEYWIANGFGNDDTFCYPLTGDFNGDGRTDAGFVRVPTSDGAGTYIGLALSNGTNFVVDRTKTWRTSARPGSLNNEWYYATFAGDFNGDGNTDIGQIHIDINTLIYIGLTLDNLATVNMANWVSGSHIYITEFSPIAADFNGDGLTDVCLFGKTVGRWAVTLSKGNGFCSTTDWLTSFGANKDPILGDFNCDGFTDIGYMLKENGQWSVKYATSDGTKFNLNSGQPYTYQTGISESIDGTFITGDFNGDGLFDIAVFNKNTHSWTVKLHHSKYPDLLVAIDNGMGGKTTITYKDSVAYENTDAAGLSTLPFSVRVVSAVTQSDGLGANYTARYFYRDGFFDPIQREFRGFGYVKVIDAEGSYKETYFNQDNIYKGRPSKEVVRDGYDRIYSQTSYNWQNRKLFSDKIDFPYLLDKTSIAYNPITGASKSAKTIYAYDDYGNAVNVRNEGFLDVTGDEQEARVAYYYDTASWILSKPVESDIRDSAGNVVAATKYEYYPNGSLRKEERWLGSVGNAPSWGNAGNPTASFTYDSTGNVDTVTDARGSVTMTAYEATKTFPSSVRNSLGHTQAFTYNKATGKILTSTDPNNQVTVSEYDGFGRLYRAAGPGGISEVMYTYDLTSSPARIMSTTKASDGKYVKAFSFIDGLGRQIMSRIEAQYQGSDKHIVSGEAKYDSRGQVIRKYLPYYINVPNPDSAYIPAQNSTPYVSYEYDAMGRLVKTLRPDNKASYTVYGINTIEAINENGQRARQTKDAYGRILEVEEDTGDLTNYAYDTLGNLTDTYDSAAPRNHVHINYDTLGRKVSMTDPDMAGFAGKSWQYQYDKAGNLIAQIDAKGQTLNFQYDAINRLTKKWGLSQSGSAPVGTVPIFYTYDDASKSNCVGRLSRVTDSSGSTEFFYDILGREIKTTKTITTASYTVERAYDSLDRLTTVKYPDNTVVGYTYNKQGGIDKIGTVPGQGSPQGGDCPYFVTSVNYNANGQIERITYGNGTSTDYKYDPYNFRLSELKTCNAQTALVQDLSYSFDPIGNVTSIQDRVNTNTQSFQYDNLNRLIQATGDSYGRIDYTHDSIGNLLVKGNLTMEYGQGAGPHAVTTLKKWGLSPGGGMTDMGTVPIFYDANGNMISKAKSDFTYDIENRLKKVTTEKGGAPFDLSINFTAGWNFFSLPGFIPNTSGNVTDILSSIDGKYEQISAYDSSTGKWLHYVGDVKYNQFNKFEIGKGYLIYMKEACTLTLSGSFPATSQTSELKTGWNLVSAPTNSEIEPSRAFRGIAYDSIAVYNGADYTYNPTTIQKGKAYWLHITTPQTWSVPLSQTETNYTYDGDGGRVLRTQAKTGTVPEGDCPYFTNVYIGSAYEIEGPAGQAPEKITKHIFMGSTRICSIESTTTVSHTYYYHPDHLGSSNVITDETGTVVNILEYSPYGEVSRNTGNYSTDKRFTGKIYDESSALSYYGARYYDPEIGRFITADPTISRPFDPQDLNRYAYCRNNPINYTDPTGYSWWSAFWSWVAGFFGAVAAVVVTAIAGPQVGMAIGGAVAGAILGAVNGGFEGALKGAAIGFAVGTGMALGIGIFGPGFTVAALAAGATYAGVTGGAEGLCDFAAGMAGSVSGYYAGNAMRYGTTNLNSKGIPRNIIAAPSNGNASVGVDGKPTNALDTNKSNTISDQIIKDPNIEGGMNQAFDESYAYDNSLRREQGGWIVSDPKDTLEIQRWPSGEHASIMHTPKPDNAITHFHTHPNYGTGGGGVKGPSGADINFTKAYGIPGYIVDKESILKVDPQTGNWTEVAKR